MTSCDHAADDRCFICDPSLRDAGRLWCKEHGRYEDRCFICHPELEEKGRLWCKEHSLYEDECHLCHPELLDSSGAEDKKTLSVAPDSEPPRDSGRLWCAEHSVYEDECVLCHPELASGGASSAELTCRAHRLPERECGICQPQLLSSHPLKVRMPSVESARKAGVRSSPAKERAHSEVVEVYAEVGFDQNRLSHVALPFACLIEDVKADLGQVVEAGTVLATVSSMEIGESVESYLQATAELEYRTSAAARERGMHERKLTTTSELQEAEAAERKARAASRQARSRLEMLGFSASQIERLTGQSQAPVHLEVRAPFSGEVVGRTAVQGAWTSGGAALFTVSDTTTMWARLDIPESLVRHVAPGQAVELSPDALPGTSVRGTLTWVAAEIDERSRLARARAEFPNPAGRLKANMFARARIETSDPRGAVVLPPSAVQQVDDLQVAFVELEPDLFEARTLEIGHRDEKGVVVLAGVSVDEPVVVASGNAVKTQLLLSRLGAGCVDD